MSEPWWRDAVMYQIYVRSFADSDGDGIGDLPGIRARLPHIRDLGVDGIWLNPFYPSPQADAGYDVADYRDVEPRFGTLDDFDALLHDAHELGLRVINDLVPNHTSDEHEWFQAALAAGPGSRERGRYLFRDGSGPDGSEPPNDWVSNFGGPAWTRVTAPDGTPEQWYLHLFDTRQPDLDWTNPEVGDEFESILRFWFDKGVDGFRIDVAHGLAKDPDLADLGTEHKVSTAGEGHPHWDLDEVHEVYRRWREVADSYDGDRSFVGEVWVETPERLARYVRSDELHTAFNFNLLQAPFDAGRMRRAIDRSRSAMEKVGAPPVWVLSNHDVVRHVTRYGDGDLGLRRARAATLLMLALPGAAYLYQGEELGLPEVTDLPHEVRQDPEYHRTGGEEPGRDGCRVPLPWEGDEPTFGFSPSGESWLPQPADWADRTAERQAGDPDSTLSLYRDALRLRRERWQEAGDDLTWLDAGDHVLAFRRGASGPCCVLNAGSEPAPRPEGVPAGAGVLLASGPVDDDGLVPAATTVWYG